MEIKESHEFLRELTDLPLVDVRSPSEYNEGHIAGAVNIPLFSDEERAIVGTLYKQQGRISAIEKGLELVGPKMKNLTQQARKVAKDGSLRLHCWRGGMRSENTAWLFELVGIRCYVLKGGFKAYRNQLLKDFSCIENLIVLQGATGTGKTEILRILKSKGEQVLDLEGHAHHRGSAFGDIGLEEQPTSLQFQNNLYADLLEMDPSRRIWVESESLTIGRVYLPETLWEKMNNSRIIELLLPKELRIQRLVEEYGHFGKDELASATRKIQKRFGGNRVKEVMEFLHEDNLTGAAGLLLEYYDKSYAHSQKKYKNTEPIRLESSKKEAEKNADLILGVAEKQLII